MTALLMAALIQTSQDFAKWGGETLDTIRQDFYIPEKKLYGESVIPGQKPKHLAFNWGCGVLLSALAAGSRSNKKYTPWLREFADHLHTYWNPLPPVPGYDVLPAPKPVDRYYDDNAWMVMALCETSDQLKDKKYLTWAQEALTYVLSGEDEKLGGGIYWRETAKKSKNTCSNGPSAAACLSVYQRTKDKALLSKAIDIYSWTKQKLQDPSDSLLWDSISLNGKINKTKWSYNTALMIRTATNLYKETKQANYKTDAIDMVKSSQKHWLKDGQIHDGGRFAHLLLESWLIAGKAIPETKLDPQTLASPLRYLHDNARPKSNHYPANWNATVPVAEDKQIELIDQASIARAQFELSQYLATK